MNQLTNIVYTRTLYHLRDCHSTNPASCGLLPLMTFLLAFTRRCDKSCGMHSSWTKNCLLATPLNVSRERPRSPIHRWHRRCPSTSVTTFLYPPSMHPILEKSSSLRKQERGSKLISKFTFMHKIACWYTRWLVQHLGTWVVCRLCFLLLATRRSCGMRSSTRECALCVSWHHFDTRTKCP